VRADRGPGQLTSLEQHEADRLEFGNALLSGGFQPAPVFHAMTRVAGYWAEKGADEIAQPL
jgi:hypothetical protein